ncbi:hypothetical protein ACHAXA_003577 [Cyclostephanos tholiformis]|uniref:2-(3-amino-3-carboxypropyl)histidine synthase subunit 1 n=1 Tax=Cyclostephanos tholiformis TaxID=382380 RepID=A0ABD3RU01_9STRA
MIPSSAASADPRAPHHISPPPPCRAVVPPRRIIRRRGGRRAVASSSSASSSSTGVDAAAPDDNDEDGPRGGDGIPSHIRNNAGLHHVISTCLPSDYEFEIPKTIARIERSNAVDVALQLPEGLTMYASTIGDILVRFAHRFRPRPARKAGRDEEEDEEGEGRAVVVDDDIPSRLNSLSVLGDVTYGACCVDDLSAKSLGCDLLIHYGHSCLVPLNRTVLPCLYVFVEISVDARHLVECVRMTFEGEEGERRRGRGRSVHGSEGEGVDDVCTLVVEACVMGTVQFRSAVVEAARMLDDYDDDDDDRAASTTIDDDDRRRRGGAVRFRTIVPQAKPLSPGEVLGCTSPSGLAELDFDAAAAESSSRRKRREARARMEDVGGDNHDATSLRVGKDLRAEPEPRNDPGVIVVASEEGNRRRRERVMIFVADGRFHLEAAMMSNPTLRALRYDPYSKTLTEERYETSKMRGLRRDAVIGARQVLGITSSSQVDDHRYRADLFSGSGGSAPLECGDDVADRVMQQSAQMSPFSHERGPPPTMGIILGTLGRQGNPAILSRVRSLLRSRGIRTAIVLLSEIFPKKLDSMSSGPGGIRAWVQIACPRLSVDWGHHFSVPVLSPYELFVALGEVDDSPLLRSGGAVEGQSERKEEEVGYPMDFYSKSGGQWANYHDDNKDRKVISYGS